MYSSAVPVALVPPGAVTVTSTVPAVPGGAVAAIEVSLSTVKAAPAVPKSTAVAPVKAVPASVTVVPPTVVPVGGLTPLDSGRRRRRVVELVGGDGETRSPRGFDLDVGGADKVWECGGDGGDHGVTVDGEGSRENMRSDVVGKVDFRGAGEGGAGDRDGRPARVRPRARASPRQPSGQAVACRCTGRRR